MKYLSRWLKDCCVRSGISRLFFPGKLIEAERPASPFPCNRPPFPFFPPRPKAMYSVGSKDNATIYRREPKFGNTAVRSTAVVEESMDEFLASFASTVAIAAANQVKLGKATFVDDIPGGGHLEKAIKRVATDEGIEVPAEKFVAGAAAHTAELQEAWPDQDHAMYKTAEREVRAAAAEQEKKDSASVFSKAAESVKSRVARTLKPDGPAELPSALLVEDARQTKDRLAREKLAAHPAKRLWGKVRETVKRGAEDYAAHKRMNPEGFKAKVRDSALPEDDGEYKPKVDAKDALYLAAVEAYERSKREGGPVDDDAASTHSRAPLTKR